MDKNAVTDSDTSPPESLPLRRGCLGYLLPLFTFKKANGLTNKPSRSGCLIPAIILCLLAMFIGYIGWQALQSLKIRIGLSARAHEIQISLSAWATDHDQRFPDSVLGPDATANQVFRRLFQDEIIASESCFSGPDSPFVPDTNIGTAPDYNRAVARGENHWMFVAGQKLTARSDSVPTPLFFENALAPTWPPIWQEKTSANPSRGRTINGRVNVAFTDGSVHWVKLVKTAQGLTLPESAYPAEWKTHPPRILDVED